ncbi:unnamed protein product, partial [Candidula unifasciata]
MLDCSKETYTHGDLSGTAIAVDSVYVLNQIIISAVIVTCFVCTKTIVDNLRRRNARITVVIVGAGPIGLTSMLVAARCGRVSRIVLYEEMCKLVLYNKPHQIAFDVKSVHFLKRLGVDFDNIEGCWDAGCFYTRLGVFQEYMLTTVPKLGVPVDLRLGTKIAFCASSLRPFEHKADREPPAALHVSSISINVTLLTSYLITAQIIDWVIQLTKCESSWPESVCTYLSTYHPKPDRQQFCVC